MPIDPKAIDDLARKLAAAVPEGVRQVGRDLEGNYKMVLQNALGKLDLVTREEFEVQQQVLARTRDKLEALARRLADLESELKPPRK